MKWYTILVFLLVHQFNFAQLRTFQFWTETGIKYKVNKQWDINLDWTNRWNEYGLITSFPQASLRLKVFDWLKVSLDYRSILSKQENGYFTLGNRINTNLQGRYKVERLELGIRARYQHSFSRIISGNYDPEFDVSYRLKPSISYDLPESFITPSASVEFFYSPNNSPLGNQFTRIRYQFGVDFETSLPVEFGLNYLFDDKINLPNAIDRHVFNFSAMYSIKQKKSSKKKKTGRVINARDL